MFCSDTKCANLFLQLILENNISLCWNQICTLWLQHLNLASNGCWFSWLLQYFPCWDSLIFTKWWESDLLRERKKIIFSFIAATITWDKRSKSKLSLQNRGGNSHVFFSASLFILKIWNSWYLFWFVWLFLDWMKQIKIWRWDARWYLT